VGLSYICKIYRIESEARRRALTPAQLVAERQDNARSTLAEFFDWLGKKTLQVVPKSLLEIAVNYAFGQ